MDWSRLNPFSAKAAPVRSEKEDPGNPVSYRSGKVAIISYPDVVNAAAAMRHPVIARCVDLIAKSVQSVPWFAELDPWATAEEQAGKTRIINDLNSLLRSPNDRMTGEAFRYWMAQNYALYTRVPFVVGQSAASRPNALYPLNARAVTASVDERGILQQYEYGMGEDKIPYPIRRKAPEGKPYLYEIARPALDGSTVTPSVMMDSGGILSSIALPAEIIKLLLRRAIDTAAGHPNTKYVVIADKNLTTKQKRDLVEHVENMAPGAEESGNILFLTNTSAKIEKLDNSLADIHSKVPMDDMTRMIAGAFGIPIALVGLGAADAAKFAGNYSESRRVFWADTIIPGYLTPFATGMTMAIGVPGVRVRFDHDQIDALRDHNIANAEKLETVSFLSVDEKREMTGFEPTKKPENMVVPSKTAKEPTANSNTPPSA
jgi:phage portal protein BeeE